MKICAVLSCNRPADGARGYCRAHYMRLWIHGDVQADIPIETHSKNIGMSCKFIDCNSPAVKLGYCNAHYLRLYRYGNPSISRRTANGTGNISRGYKIITVKGERIPEHRYIMEQHICRPLLPFPLEVVHHKNGNRLDNRIENLELKSQSTHMKTTPRKRDDKGRFA